MDLSKLQNGSDVRGVALPGVAGESVTLDDAAVRAAAGGLYRPLSGPGCSGSRSVHSRGGVEEVVFADGELVLDAEGAVADAP